MNESKAKSSVICYFDPKNATEGRCAGIVDYCHGCKQNICEGHARNLSLMGSHTPDEHLISEDEVDE